MLPRHRDLTRNTLHAMTQILTLIKRWSNNRYFNAITGKGVEATVDNNDIKVVSPGYLKEKSISLPANYNTDATETVVFVLVNDKLAGYISLSDSIRPESAEAIKILHSNNIKSVLLTGDNKQVAETVAHVS